MPWGAFCLVRFWFKKKEGQSIREGEGVSLWSDFGQAKQEKEGFYFKIRRSAKKHQKRKCLFGL